MRFEHEGFLVVWLTPDLDESLLYCYSCRSWFFKDRLLNNSPTCIIRWKNYTGQKPFQKPFFIWKWSLRSTCVFSIIAYTIIPKPKCCLDHSLFLVGISSVAEHGCESGQHRVQLPHHGVRQVYLHQGEGRGPEPGGDCGHVWPHQPHQEAHLCRQRHHESCQQSHRPERSEGSHCVLSVTA